MTSEKRDRPARTWTTPMIGRRVEFERLAEAVHKALRGTGSVFFIGGEAGIGKSRLVQEVIAASKDQFNVCVGECFEGEAAMPFRPWVEVLRIIAEQEAFGPESTPQADLTAETTSRYDDGEDDAERLRIFDGVLRSIRSACLGKPLLIVLEDLHWADPSTIRLLRHVARRTPYLPIVVAVTYRTTEVAPHDPLQRVIDEALERQLGTAIQLLGLEMDETAQLCDSYGSSPIPLRPETVARLWRRTRGNPFFLDAIIGQLRQPAVGDSAAAIENIPNGVLEVIRYRVGHRSPNCVHLLRSAAVLGRSFSLEVLSELAGCHDQQLSEGIGEAIAARLIEQVDDAANRFAFVHALVQEALLSTIDPQEARDLHMRAAQAIERNSNGSAQGLAEVLTRHYRLAHSPRAMHRLVATGTTAIQQAFDASAWEEAGETFEATLAELEALGASALVRARFVHQTLGKNFQRTGLPARRLLELAEPAAESLLAAGDRDGAAAMLMSVLWCLIIEDSFEFLDPLRALTIIDSIRVLTDERFLHLQCDGHYPMVLCLLGRIDEMAVAAQKRMENPRPEARVSGRIYYAASLCYRGYPSLGHQNFELAWDETRRIDPATAPAIRAVGSMGAGWGQGSMLRFRAPALGGEFVSRELGLARQPARIRRQTEIFEALSRRECGLVVESSETLRRLLPRAEAWTDVYLAQLSFMEGKWETANSGIKASLDMLSEAAAETRALLSEVLADQIRHRDPLTASGPIRPDHLNSEVPLFRVMGHAVCGLIAAELGDFVAVREHAKSARASMTDDDWLGLGARVEFLEAIAGLAAGDSAGWSSKFDSAIATMRRVEHPWDESDAHYVLGTVLVRLGRPQEAICHFDKALNILRRIEAAQPFVDRVLTARRLTDAPEPGPLHEEMLRPDGLSNRQLEVLRLLAGGLSNRQIGAKLVISDPTVATHVRNILQKTGSANRTEAAAFAIRNGLDTVLHHQIG